MKREKYVKGTKQGRHLLENNISKKKEKKRSVSRCVLHSCKCNFEGDTLMVQEKTTKPYHPHSALLHSSFLLPPIPPPAQAPSQNYLHFEVEFVPLPATRSCCFLSLPPLCIKSLLCSKLSKDRTTTSLNIKKKKTLPVSK